MRAKAVIVISQYPGPLISGSGIFYFGTPAIFGSLE
jgi:hypothetical protein